MVLSIEITKQIRKMPKREAEKITMSKILQQFKQFIGKIGGDGLSQFFRLAVRKVFADELASLFSWKGTNEKPRAERCFCLTIIKNITHLKYEASDKDITSIIQKHFVYAKERVTKRKRQDN